MKNKVSFRGKVKIILSAVLVVAVMAVIFAMSSQNGGASSSSSNGFGEWFLGILGIEIPAGQTASEIELFAGLKIRNLAHIFLFACLGASSYMLSASLWAIIRRLTPTKVALSAVCAFAWSLFYACTDELHQYFVPGRYATLRDVGIDCIGIVLAVAVCSIIQLIIIAVRNRSVQKNI